MRKYFLYLAAILIVSSCDNLKKKDKSTTDDEEVTPKKKKKALDEDETAEEETPKKKKPVMDDETTNEDEKPLVVNVTEDGAELKWTTADRKTFTNECVQTAEKNVGEERAKVYCSCFLEKIEKKYVSYDEANRKMKQPEIDKWAAECNQ